MVLLTLQKDHDASLTENRGLSLFISLVSGITWYIPPQREGESNPALKIPTELIFCSHVIVYFAILSRMRGNHSQVDLRPINCLGLTGIREFLKELASKKRLLYLVSYQDLVSKMDSPSDRKKFTYSSGLCQRIKQKDEQNCKCSLKLFFKFNGQIPLLFDKKFLLQLSFCIPQPDD